MPRLTIRTLEAADIPDAVLLDRLTSPPSQRWYDRHFAVLLARPDRYRVLLGLDGAAYLGHVVGVLHDRRVEVTVLAVHPEHRRMGIGTCFVRRLYEERDLRSRDLFCATVSESNVTAQLFLRGMGWHAIRTVPRAFGTRDGIRFVGRRPAQPRTVAAHPGGTVCVAAPVWNPPDIIRKRGGDDFEACFGK